MGLLNIFKRNKADTDKKIIDTKKLEKSLNNTSERFLVGFNNIIKKGNIDSESFEELEEILLTSDISMNSVLKIMNSLRKEKIKNINELKILLKERMLNLIDINNSLNTTEQKPYIIIVVGVNGVGKTTSIAKLANLFLNNGNSVAIAACDTFRAAAIEQLEVWGNRLKNVPVIKQHQGSDPSAVLYDAINYCKSKKTDVLIADTAGRLHTKVNLMNELKKIINTSKKIIEDAPHEILLVLDATMGQNALNQARVFKEEVNPTGIILTKLDGTAKGGIIISIIDELNLPVKFVGTGEKLDDLDVFDAQVFIENIIK
jgi:fused signal recognition particle receptor